MTRFFVEAFLQAIIPAVFAFFLVGKKTTENYLRIALFLLIYVFYQIVLILPKMSQTLNFIDSRWNWEGKLLGILFGIVCYFVFRKYFAENDFFTLRQDRENFKKVLTVSAFAVLLVALIAYFTGKSEFNAETLAFQLTMPAIDEEIMFRGILLGLLMTALSEKIPFLKNPAVILTAILFGLTHALTFDKDFSINFEPIYFIHTGIGGLIFGWITWKTRSILLAVIVHGVANFLAALATMMK